MCNVAKTNSHSLVGFYKPSKYTQAKAYFERTAGASMRKHPNATLAGVYLLCGATFLSINAVKTAALVSGGSSPLLIASAACGIVGSSFLVFAGINYYFASQFLKKIRKLEAELQGLKKEHLELRDNHGFGTGNLKYLLEKKEKNLQDKIDNLKEKHKKYDKIGKILSFGISVPFAIGTTLFCIGVPEFAAVAAVGLLSVITSTCFMTGATSKSAKDLDKIVPKYNPFNAMFGGKTFNRFKHHLFTVAGTAISISSIIGIKEAFNTARKTVAESGVGDVSQVGNYLTASSAVGVFGGATVVALAGSLHVIQSVKFAKDNVLKNIGQVKAILDVLGVDNIKSQINFDEKKGRFVANDANNPEQKKIANKLNNITRLIYLYGDEAQFKSIKDKIDSIAVENDAVDVVDQILNTKFDEKEQEAINEAKDKGYTPSSSWRNYLTYSRSGTGLQVA